jgi:glucan endo-1,3-alpha-glucosidase
MSAASNSIDAFVLNLGRDSWQPARVADAYQAAKTLSDRGTLFHLLISFDMTSLPCGGAGDADTLRFYINTYSSHPNHFVYNGKPLFSTFAGDTCTFGQGDPNAGWLFAVKSGPQISFVPAFFNTESLPAMMDGVFNVRGCS